MTRRPFVNWWRGRSKAMDLKAVEEKFHQEIQQVQSMQDLLEVKARFLGKKGHLSTLLRELGTLPAEQRPLFGARANELKDRMEAECRSLLERIKTDRQAEQVRSELIDVTLPGRDLAPGRLHPVTQVLEEVEDIFVSLGFDIFEGPEVETDYYNFEALNIPANHPARDMQDTFYLGVAARTSPPSPPAGPLGLAKPDPRGSQGDASPLLLRTHTSPVQIHVMESHQPPIRMIAPGVVYRRDSDVSHSPMFHQVEGLVVGHGVRFSDLKGCITRFLGIFFEKPRIRFRPSYFPFTEPSAEVDVWWQQSTSPEGATRAPKKGGWLEVMGCGMVHPNLFRQVGYDPKQVTGFAFGLGIERLAMLKLEIPDIRMFFENDLRFLEQF